MIRNAISVPIMMLGITLAGCGVEPTDTTSAGSQEQSLSADEDQVSLACTAACWTHCSSNGRGWTQVYRVTDGNPGNCVGRSYDFSYDHACMHWGCSSFACP
jgi:hypothetical protein